VEKGYFRDSRSGSSCSKSPVRRDPHEIEEIVEKAGVHLFLGSTKDLKTDSNCPDYANPCKHIAAVYYILAERFDADPFLIFAMRGKEKKQS
jgi:uncharacterized Zn finger protein